MTFSVYLRQGETAALILTRGRGDGLDTRKANVKGISGDTLILHVPGHKESSGYDRLAGGNTYSYVPAASHACRVISADKDQFGHTSYTLERI